MSGMHEQPQNARFFAAMRIVQDHATSSLFPVTIVMSRYEGTYEGARWLAFPVGAEDLADSDYAAEDVECMSFFAECETRQVPIGRGPTPDDALENLRTRLGVIASE
jgi:hypothetical protein